MRNLKFTISRSHPTSTRRTINRSIFNSRLQINKFRTCDLHENKYTRQRRAFRMNTWVVLQETDFRQKRVRSYMLLQRSSHSCILGFQQQTVLSADEKKIHTLSQLH